MKGCLYALAFLGGFVAGGCLLLMLLAWAGQHVHGPG